MDQVLPQATFNSRSTKAFMSSLVINVTDSAWVNVHDSLSIDAGTPVTVFNKSGFTNLFLATSATQPTVKNGMPLWEHEQQYVNPGDGLSLWVISIQGNAEVYATDEPVTGALPSYAYSRDDRIRIEQLLIGQQYVVDGIGFELNWVELTPVPIGQSAYATVDVPAGYYMALDTRLLNPSADRMLYRVYPEGTYTLGALKVDTGDDLILTRNLRQGVAFNSVVTERRNVSVAPATTSAVVYEPLWGTVNAGNRSVGDVESDQAFLLLSPDQQFLLEVKNASTTNTLSFQVKIYFALIPEAGILPPIV